MRPSVDEMARSGDRAITGDSGRPLAGPTCATKKPRAKARVYVFGRTKKVCLEFDRRGFAIFAMRETAVNVEADFIGNPVDRPISHDHMERLGM